jgi:hypothetical protein
MRSHCQWRSARRRILAKLPDLPPPPRPTSTEKTTPLHGRRCNFVFPPKNDLAIYEYPNTYFKYTGDWQNGIKHGKGILEIGRESTYTGDFQNGEITGNGRRVFANGNTYEGEFLDGEFSGHGVFHDCVTGETYDGDWKDNRRQGEGVLRLADGTVYRGHFEDHKRNGHGEYAWSDGRSYVGEWQNNAIQGQGTMTYANGDVYSGEFVDGKRHGQGTMQWAATNLTFTGEWANDESAYHPTGLEIVELPPITPGTLLAGIVIGVVGGAGESGRRLRGVIEIGRFDPAGTQKKLPKVRKGDHIDIAPRFMSLNTNTGETFLEVLVENGQAKFPAIPVSLDAEPNTYTLTVTDLSAIDPLPEVVTDLTWVSPGLGQSLGKQSQRIVKRGTVNSRTSDRKSARGGKA